MRYILQFILVLWSSVAFSQTPNDLNSRAKSGDLTYNECMSLLNTEMFPNTIPSLLNLKKRYEQEDLYNGDIYSEIVIALNFYYISNADYTSSRNLLDEAVQTLNKRETEPNNKLSRNLLCCRGELEVMLNNYGEGLTYLIQAQTYFEEENDYCDSYLSTMLDIALAYQNSGDLLSAKIYMDEAIEQFENLHGSIYEIREEKQLMVLNNYGYLNSAIGHDQLAEKCFSAVIKGSHNILASQDAYILASNNLATIYMKQNKWKEAAKILEAIDGNSERNYIFALNKIICYKFLNNKSLAINALQEMNICSLENIEKIFSHFAGIERENYWSAISKDRILLNNLIAYHTQDDQAVSIAYDNALFCKNLRGYSSILMDRYAESSNDADVKLRYKEYKDLKVQLAYKTKTQQSKDSLSKRITNIERSILDSAGNLGQWLSNGTKKWKDVQEALDADEVAIEFCYAPRMEKYDDVKQYYSAFILRKDSKYPKLVSLENVDVVEEALDSDNPDEIFINTLYSSDKVFTLYKMLWEKLLPYLKGIKTVYYSPTGDLLNVNFDILQAKDGTMLNDRYNMYRVSSTASIADVKAYMPPLHDAVLYGNVKYDETTTDMADASSAYDNFSGTAVRSELSLRSENERGKWGPIPSTKKEIDDISALLTHKGIKVSVLEGSLANEESFKALSGNSPEILHIATHGFVINTPQKAAGNKFVASTTAYTQKDACMMWAGLMFAGGNNIWQGNFNLTNVEDGILTADEISRLDLSNTKLVVLSACETAKGEIDPVDGVYGLQRAFKMAGAQTIVMSLWKVQDDATSMLMAQFYTYLTNGVEKHKALWKAMMDVREKYKDPYYWAGFIMLD